MLASSSMQDSDEVKSQMPETQVVMITVPPGVTAGQTIQFEVNGVERYIQVPAGVTPGQQLSVEVPRSSTLIKSKEVISDEIKLDSGETAANPKTAEEQAKALDAVLTRYLGDLQRPHETVYPGKIISNLVQWASASSPPAETSNPDDVASEEQKSFFEDYHRTGLPAFPSELCTDIENSLKRFRQSLIYSSNDINKNSKMEMVDAIKTAITICFSHRGSQTALADLVTIDKKLNALRQEIQSCKEEASESLSSESKTRDRSSSAYLPNLAPLRTLLELLNKERDLLTARLELIPQVCCLRMATLDEEEQLKKLDGVREQVTSWENSLGQAKQDAMNHMATLKQHIMLRMSQIESLQIGAEAAPEGVEFAASANDYADYVEMHAVEPTQVVKERNVKLAELVHSFNIVAEMCERIIRHMQTYCSEFSTWSNTSLMQTSKSWQDSCAQRVLLLDARKRAVQVHGDHVGNQIAKIDDMIEQMGGLESQELVTASLRQTREKLQGGLNVITEEMGEVDEHIAVDIERPRLYTTPTDDTALTPVAAAPVAAPVLPEETTPVQPDADIVASLVVTTDSPPATADDDLDYVMPQDAAAQPTVAVVSD